MIPAIDSLGIGTTLILLGAVLLWIGLAAILGPLIGRWLKGDYSDEHPDRERVGLLDEPTDFELHRLRSIERAANGHRHAERSRKRRVL